jgi:hypothetical protein
MHGPMNVKFVESSAVSVVRVRDYEHGSSISICNVDTHVRLKSGNACRHSVQNLLSSNLQSKNIKIKKYRTVILPVVCLGVKLGRWHWGRNVGWGCLRIWCRGEYFGLRGTKKQGSGENYITSCLTICSHPIIFGWSNREEWDGPGI